MLEEYKQNPTPEEARFLRESQWIIGLSKGPGWNLLKSEMERMVNLCREMVENSESSDPQVNDGLRLRLKLTKAITKDIVTWVESTESKHQKLVTELMSEPEEHESWLQRISDQFFTEETDEYATDNA